MTSSTNPEDASAEQQLVTAIIVNWNGARLLEQCVPSLMAQDYPRLEVVVVDNGSTDDSREVAERFDASWLPLGANRGLAGGMHEGALAAEGTYLLFLNNDMRFERDFVSELVGGLESHPEAFAVDAKQTDWDGNKIVHERIYLERDRSASAQIPGWTFLQESASAISPCAYASAANILVRAEDYREIGGWDARLPLAFEDVDLALRAWARGRSTLYVPTAIAHHDVSASTRTGEGDRLRRRGQTIGLLVLAEKHLPLRSVLGLAFKMLRSAAGGLIRGEAAAARTQLAALGRGLRAVPHAIRERRARRRLSGRSPQEQLQWLATITAPTGKP